MALNFPSTPTLDQTYSLNGRTWKWNGTSWIGVGSLEIPQTLSDKILNSATLNSYTEGVFAVTGTTPALSPTNGPIQTWTLTANSVPTQGSWASGQSMVLAVADTASAFTVTWTSLPVTWLDGLIPTTTPAGGYTFINLWKIGNTIYGVSSGQAV